MERKNILTVLAFILLCEAAGNIGSIFTFPEIMTWYVSISKPGFTPPNWAFGPVWTTLFALMGVSLYLVWKQGLKEKKVRIALSVFGAQLVLNILWSILFFGAKLLFAAFVEIVALWIAILLTIIAFYRVQKKAGIMLVPYLLWVTLATLLTYYVWLLNP